MADAIALGLVARVAGGLALALKLASGLAGGAGGRRQDWRGPEAKWAPTDFSVSEYSLTM